MECIIYCQWWKNNHKIEDHWTDHNRAPFQLMIKHYNQDIRVDLMASTSMITTLVMSASRCRMASSLLGSFTKTWMPNFIFSLFREKSRQAILALVTFFAMAEEEEGQVRCRNTFHANQYEYSFFTYYNWFKVALQQKFLHTDEIIRFYNLDCYASNKVGLLQHSLNSVDHRGMAIFPTQPINDNERLKTRKIQHL